MRRVSILLAALLAAACSSNAGSPKAGNAGPTGPAVDFVPTKLILSVDGEGVPIEKKGYLTNAEKTSVAYGLGAAKGDQPSGTMELPHIDITSKGKELTAVDFTQTDAELNVALNWVKDLNKRAYTADPSAKITIHNVDGKLNLTYAGPMNRGDGTGEDFPQKIMVQLVAYGLPVTP